MNCKLAIPLEGRLNKTANTKLLRSVLSIVALLCCGIVFAGGEPFDPSVGFVVAALVALLTEAAGVRLPFFGTISFGLLVYLPLICLPNFGPKQALVAALAGLSLRELLSFSSPERLRDEFVLDLLPLSLSCTVPRFLGKGESEFVLWLAVGLCFTSLRHLTVKLAASSLDRDTAEISARLQKNTADLRWGLLALSILSVALMQKEPFLILGLVPVVLSLRKAAIHAYAWLDKQDKKRLRSEAGELSKSLIEAESKISNLSSELETTESQRDLLTSLSKQTVDCGSLSELLVMLNKRCQSLELGGELQLLVREAQSWLYLQLDSKGRPQTSSPTFEQVGPGFQRCWKTQKMCASKKTGRLFYPMPGVGVLSFLRPKIGGTKAEKEIAELFSTQAALACLSARRFELREKALKRQAELNEELKDAMEQLKASEAQLLQSAKLAAVGQLSAGLAHEINNPLGSIRLAIDATLKKENLSELSRKLLTKAQQGVERAQGITGSLLTYSRAGGKGRTKLDVWDVVLDSCAFLAASLHMLNIQFEVPDRGKPSTVLANAQELQQILTNLIMNARDAVSEQKERSIKVTARSVDSNCFLIEVHDNGSGIPEEVAEKIFDPFFTTKPVGQGTGLGLSVSRQLAEGQEGELGFHPSEELGGACFYLRLPLLAFTATEPS